MLHLRLLFSLGRWVHNLWMQPHIPFRPCCTTVECFFCPFPAHTPIRWPQDSQHEGPVFESTWARVSQATCHWPILVLWVGAAVPTGTSALNNRVSTGKPALLMKLLWKWAAQMHFENVGEFSRTDTGCSLPSGLDATGWSQSSFFFN